MMGQNHGGRSDGDGNDGGGGSRDRGIVVEPWHFYALPEDCISTIISFASPRDACVVASVSRIFRSAAQSDIVWERFLPPEYPSLVSQSGFFSSKKEFYLALSDDPVLIDDGRKSFWLEKPSGKKCYMLSARDLKIIWGHNPAYWRWVSLPEARFEEVAELINVCWFEIRGKMNTRMLSPGTHYSAYVVFKMRNRCYGFDSEPVEAGVGVVGSEVSRRFICFDVEKPGDSSVDAYPYIPVRGLIRIRRPREEKENLVEPKERRDGWMEIELGRFFNNGGADGDEIEMSILETKCGHWKSGLIVQGIEIRPTKDGN